MACLVSPIASMPHWQIGDAADNRTRNHRLIESGQAAAWRWVAGPRRRRAWTAHGTESGADLVPLVDAGPNAVPSSLDLRFDCSHGQSSARSSE